MSKFKTLLGLLFVACIIGGSALPRCEAAKKGDSQTWIKRVHLSVKGHRTCLIFDAKGARPKQIGPASSTGISVFFPRMITRLPNRVFRSGKIAARAIKFRRGGGFFEVLFREKNTPVLSRIRPGKHEEYTLTLELTSPGKTSEPQAGRPEGRTSGSAEQTEEKPDQVEVKKVQTSELFGSRVSKRIRNAAIVESEAKQGESSRPPRSDSKPQAFVKPDAGALALYASANAKFEGYSQDLSFYATQIIQAYDKALRTCPLCPQAPLAVYRSGLVYFAAGQYAQAEKLFRMVVSRWPDQPVAARCWISIGDICNKKQAYLEAMEAFRWALRCAGENKDDKAAAYYELGKLYVTLGANKEALEMLEDCTALEPDYYTKKPDVFRFGGDANFALGNLEKAKELLLRYVNCQQKDPDQDIVLAKIAEIFLNQGQVDTARKMYAFIHLHYPDSQGDLICRIRQAELIEKDNLRQAIRIYEGLRSKDLSPSLRRIVLMKLAELNLKRCDLAHSLALMDEAFPVRNDGSSPPGAAALRDRILQDLVRRYFSARDFMKVVQLHEKYRLVFDSLKSPETLEQVAESYASLKFYSNALQIYDRLIAKGPENRDELLLRCAVYALRLNDAARALQYCNPVQSQALSVKKSEIMGHIFYRNKQYAEAVESFGKVLDKTREFRIADPDSYEAYGCCLYQIKKPGEAIPILQKAMLRAKAGDNFTRCLILVTLSNCFKEQKRYREAAETMKTAISISGKDQKNELLYELSKLYVSAAQADKAVQSLNRIKATEDPFWSAVAQQQINTIEMSRANPAQ